VELYSYFRKIVNSYTLNVRVTNSIELSPFWEAAICVSIQEFSEVLLKSKANFSDQKCTAKTQPHPE
jgi:hypothetical protein